MLSGRNSPSGMNIRNARDDEYAIIGRIHAEAVGSDPLVQLLSSQVDPDVLLQWNWIDGAKASVARGDATVLVLERVDTNELVGLASYTVFDGAKQPQNPKSYPEGFDAAVSEEREKPVMAWIRELTEKHAEVLYITRFAVLPSYQSRGFGRAIMDHIIAQAKGQHLNIALSALSGKASFYAKFGFKKVAPPMMFESGTVEAATMMFLELCKPSVD